MTLQSSETSAHVGGTQRALWTETAEEVSEFWMSGFQESSRNTVTQLFKKEFLELEAIWSFTSLLESPEVHIWYLTWQYGSLGSHVAVWRNTS